MLPALRSGTIDVAVSLCPEVAGEFSYQPIRSEPVIALLAHAHPLAGRRRSICASSPRSVSCSSPGNWRRVCMTSWSACAAKPALSRSQLASRSTAAGSSRFSPRWTWSPSRRRLSDRVARRNRRGCVADPTTNSRLDRLAKGRPGADVMAFRETAQAVFQSAPPLSRRVCSWGETVSRDAFRGLPGDWGLRSLRRA